MHFATQHHARYVTPSLLLCNLPILFNKFNEAPAILDPSSDDFLPLDVAGEDEEEDDMANSCTQVDFSPQQEEQNKNTLCN